ncbi:Uncharacterised protein [Candidatus Bilamarchaeum dharawalense]|uniref:Uncharacterized protein n=1 Tax=Candidatus Bilamarchaeum dharawalense TaxID=2885759 RepID=A0A5E4LPT3_9ARCH|nr:Uncharacterised protein [Candidatus Bilamarchaeum dharawalense]
MADMDDKTIGLIIGGTVLVILLIAAFFIAGDFGTDFFGAIILLITYFIGPVILLGISAVLVSLISTHTPIKIPEGPINTIAVIFLFCLLLVLYGALLGYYPIELITSNLPFFLAAFAVTAIASYIILKLKQMIFGRPRSL